MSRERNGWRREGNRDESVGYKDRKVCKEGKKRRIFLQERGRKNGTAGKLKKCSFKILGKKKNGSLSSDKKRGPDFYIA